MCDSRGLDVRRAVVRTKRNRRTRLNLNFRFARHRDTTLRVRDFSPVQTQRHKTNISQPRKNTDLLVPTVELIYFRISRETISVR
jgi:hypothetical protein